MLKQKKETKSHALYVGAHQKMYYATPLVRGLSQRPRSFGGVYARDVPRIYFYNNTAARTTHAALLPARRTAVKIATTNIAAHARTHTFYTGTSLQDLDRERRRMIDNILRVKLGRKKMFEKKLYLRAKKKYAQKSIKLWSMSEEYGRKNYILFIF